MGLKRIVLCSAATVVVVSLLALIPAALYYTNVSIFVAVCGDAISAGLAVMALVAIWE